MIQHLAFIMDGNRRYANKNKISLHEGYKKGMEKFVEIINYQVEYKIPETTFFALSNDNYIKRPTEEKKILVELMKMFSENKQLEEFFLQNNIKIQVKGDLNAIKRNEKKGSSLFSKEIDSLSKKFEEYNEKIQTPQFKVNLALNYDGQKEIVSAVKNIVKKIENKEIKSTSINQKTIKENLYFNDSTAPEVIVRTGNVPRISGFLLWDSAYSEMYFSRKLWPELNKADIEDIITWYSSIQRNFGK